MQNFLTIPQCLSWMPSSRNLATLGTLVFLYIVVSGSTAEAQTLIHRYSFNGNANDSVGTAHGTPVGNVLFATSSGINGKATFAGNTASTAPGYIKLPISTVSTLQNATIEIFTTSFDPPKNQPGIPGGYFQTLFSLATPPGIQTNFITLTPNFSGAGIGFSAQKNGVGGISLTSREPLPLWQQNHVIDLVFSGFRGIDTTGTVTIYLDGGQIAQGQTSHSFASVATGTGGVSNVGIGGGSPWDDPTFRGSINEVRIFNGSLTPTQIAANIAAGPATLGYIPALTIQGASVSTISDMSAEVTWNTSHSASSTVQYGTTNRYGSTATGANAVTAHSVLFTGLIPATTYHYRIVSIDTYGQTTVTTDATFLTAARGTPRVAIRNVSLSNDAKTDETTATVTLNNSGTGDAANVQITSSRLGSSPTKTTLPFLAGNCARGNTISFSLRFPLQPSGQHLLFRLTGKSVGSAFSASVIRRIP